MSRSTISLSTVASTILLLLPVLLAGAIVSTGWHAGTGRPSAAPQAATVDPRLIVRSRTITQTISVGGSRLTLAASPLIPGTNHLELSLTDHGRAMQGARVSIGVKMTDMSLPPFWLAVHETQGGRYEAKAPLTMFGPWRITVKVDQPGGLHLSHAFALVLGLPPGLLDALPGAAAASTPTAGSGYPSG